jgi:hypothetical protein
MSSTIWGFVTPSTDSCLSGPVFWGKTRQGDPLRSDDRCRISISFFIAIAVAVHKGNLFRTLISGSLIMTMTLWITNQTIPWVTALAKSTGALSGDGLAAAMDQGGSPITYIFVELFQRDNFAGLLVIGCIYIVCLAVSVQYSRAEKARSEDDTL